MEIERVAGVHSRKDSATTSSASSSKALDRALGGRPTRDGESPPRQASDDPPAGRVSDRESKTRLRVVDYNVAGGSPTHKANFEGKTSEYLAGQMVDEDADLATLQEVKVSRELGDFNLEIIEDLAEESLGKGWDANEEKARYYDASGRETTDELKATRVVYPMSNGQDSKELVVEKEQLEVPLEGSRPPSTRKVTVYRSTLDGEDGYSVVFGPSRVSKNSQYGNAVVLAPGSQLPRRADGRVDPGAIRMGQVGEDPDDREPRTALGVTFTASSGEEVNALSAHLTNRGEKERDEAIRSQYGKLADFSQAWYADDNVVIGADLNSSPGKDGFPSVDFEAYSSDGKDVVMSDGRVENEDRREKGGSDHYLVVTDVVL